LAALDENTEAQAGVAPKDKAIAINGFIVDEALVSINAIEQDSTNSEDEDVIRAIVATFAQLTEFTEFIDVSTFDTTVDAMLILINSEIT